MASLALKHANIYDVICAMHFAHLHSADKLFTDNCSAINDAVFLRYNNTCSQDAIRTCQRFCLSFSFSLFLASLPSRLSPPFPFFQRLMQISNHNFSLRITIAHRCNGNKWLTYDFHSCFYRGVFGPSERSGKERGADVQWRKFVHSYAVPIRAEPNPGDGQPIDEHIVTTAAAVKR